MIHVREKPPLRTHLEAIAPSGRRYRWGDDEPDPANVPSGLRYSSTMPGGFETIDCVLPRKPSIDYSDLARLSTLRVIDASGGIAGEYRLERAPRVSGDRMAVSPSGVGWQAALEDNKSVRALIRDIDINHWRSASRQREVQLLTDYPVKYQLGQFSVGQQADTDGIPAIRHDSTQLACDLTTKGIGESWYDARGLTIAELFYELVCIGLGNGADAAWVTTALLSDDDRHTAFDGGTDHNGADGPTTATLAAAAATRQFATLQTIYTGMFTGDGQWTTWWRRLAVYGDHGLTLRGSDPDAGFWASDIVRHVVETFAPILNVTDDSIAASGFVIPHAAYLEPTTAAEIVRNVTRYGLQDWAVWEDLTFWWHTRNARGRTWRARIGAAHLEETGPQVDRLWESVIVQYQDVDGSTRTVGPPGSGSDTETSDLKDDDPENPANQLGIIRRDLLQMGVGTAASATEIGRRFLEQTKILDSSGRARLVGHVEDDRGVIHPYHRVRAGDRLVFPDAADTSARRIVRADHDHPSRTCSVDLDAPPDGLAALLERLGVVLIPLGL